MNEALTLALEALEGVLDNSPKVLDASISGGLYEVVQCRDAITAIKEALAQPEQKPVGWMNPSWIDPDTRGWQSDSFESKPIEGWLPIYASPPQPEQEPVARVIDNGTPEGATEWIPFTNRVEPLKTGDLLYTHAEERNFCPRCGKRTADLTTIHTCTPPPREW